MIRLCCLVLAGLGLTQAQSYGNVTNSTIANAIYKDASQPVDARVENLVSLMTLQEKTAQLMQGKLPLIFHIRTCITISHRRYFELA